MKVGFTIREKLYAQEHFEIECDSEDQVDDALDDIGECVSGEELDSKLREIFGSKNVKSDGISGTDNIVPEDEYDFEDWD